MRKLFFSLFVLLSACGASEEALEFTEFNQEGFLAACTQTGEDINLDQRASEIDSELITQICGCVWDETSSDLPFSEFQALDSVLTEDASAELPVGIQRVIADCVVAELSL